MEFSANTRMRDVRQTILSLIEKATSKRLAHVEAQDLLELKRYAKADDENVRTIYGALKENLRARHSQVRNSHYLLVFGDSGVIHWLPMGKFRLHAIHRRETPVCALPSQTRYLAVTVCHEFFARSRLFRVLLVEDIDGFLEQTLGHRPENPLPAPPASAQLLRDESLRCLESWDTSFGDHYRALAVAARFVRQVLQLRPSGPTPQERERLEQEQRHRQLMARYEALLRSYDGALAAMRGAAESAARMEALLQEITGEASRLHGGGRQMQTDRPLPLRCRGRGGRQCQGAAGRGDRGRQGAPRRFRLGLGA